MPIIFLSALILLFAGSAHPTDAASLLMLSEIQVAGASANDEYVELWNPSDTSISLSGWSLRKKTKSDTTTKGLSVKTFSAGDSLAAHGYFLWTNTKSIFTDFADTTTTAGLADDTSLALYDQDGVQIDALTWGSSHVAPFVPAAFSNPTKDTCFVRDESSLVWRLETVCSPSNSHGETWPLKPPAPKVAGPETIRINEVFPNPDTKGDLGEYIELFNYGNATVDLSGWIIHDATKTGKYTFPNGVALASQAFLVITDQEFTFSLNNSNETLTLSDGAGTILQSVSYVKTKESISLNLVGDVLRGAKEPTPGALNSENTEPTTRERVPKKGYRGFTIEFRARGSDNDGDHLKYTWDFGDKHKSYKEKTTHKYLETGKYTVLLTTDDGIDTVTETFEITIQKYEPPKLRIIALVPNPEGKDTLGEWIEIENREKKTVNLKGFSIATGTKSKKLTNHPIREDLTLPAKSKLKITRENSLFTLGNQKGYVELRAPDGKSISKLKYTFEKGLADNVILKKEKGKKLAPEVPEAAIETQPEEILSNTPENPLETSNIAPEIQSQEVILENPDILIETSETPDGIVLGASTDIPSNQIQNNTNHENSWPNFLALFSNWLEHLNEKLNSLFLNLPQENSIF